MGAVPSMLVNRGRGTSSSTEDIEVVLLFVTFVGGEYCTGENAIDEGCFPVDGIARGGDVATVGCVGGEPDRSMVSGLSSAARESMGMADGAGTGDAAVWVDVGWLGN